MRVAAVAAGILMTALSTPALATPINLVPNGTFSAGNTGFTSEHTYTTPSNTLPGQYDVRQNSALWNSWFINAAEHTGDDGGMLVVNGATEAKSVWATSFLVDVDTDYTFSAWAMNVCCRDGYPGPGGANTANLSFYLNGDLLASIGVGTRGLWVGGNGLWNSGKTTSVTLELRNANILYSGNDFAVDDIFFGRSPTVVDPEEENPVVPEPSTWTLMALGGLAAAWARRRQRRA